MSALGARAAAVSWQARARRGIGAGGRNLALDGTAAVGAGIAIGVVNGLLPGIGRLAGLDAVGLAALASTQYAANVFAVFAGYLGYGSPRRIAAIRAIGSLSLALAVVVPTWGLPPVATIFWLSAALSTPLQHRVWGAIYPIRARARLVSLVRAAQSTASAATALVGGLAADRYGGLPVVGVAGALGGLLLLSYARIRAAPGEGSGGFAWRESLRMLMDHPSLRPLVTAQGLWGAGTIGATPLYALVQVDRLHLSLAQIGSVAIVTSAATIATYFCWGIVADRWGGGAVMVLGAVFGLLTPILYAFAPDVGLLWLAAAFLGVSNAAIDVGTIAVFSRAVPLEQRSAHMAGWTSFTGIRGVIAPFLAGGLVQLGLVAPMVALLLCGGVALAGLGLYVSVYRGHRAELGPQPKRGR